jgi:hypothetical protein
MHRIEGEEEFFESDIFAFALRKNGLHIAFTHGKIIVNASNQRQARVPKQIHFDALMRLENGNRWRLITLKENFVVMASLYAVFRFHFQKIKSAARQCSAHLPHEPFCREAQRIVMIEDEPGSAYRLRKFKCPCRCGLFNGVKVKRRWGEAFALGVARRHKLYAKASHRRQKRGGARERRRLDSTSRFSAQAVTKPHHACAAQYADQSHLHSRAKRVRQKCLGMQRLSLQSLKLLKFQERKFRCRFEQKLRTFFPSWVGAIQMLGNFFWSRQSMFAKQVEQEKSYNR